jgi:uncharacterized membrane protein/protein-disulfide isomerase
MARAAVRPTPTPPPKVIRWLVVAALAGLAFAAASTWIHYRILHDPFYSSVCDVNATVSCTQAYTSRFGSFAGVPIALLGVLYFAFILGLIALCQRSATARQNLLGYVFVASTIGLAGVLYLAYASFVVLQTVCLLCVGTYAAVVALFLISGGSEKSPMTTLPRRASRDVGTLLRTPAALAFAVVFLAAAVLAVMRFPIASVSASGTTPAATATPAAAQAAASPQLTPEVLKQLDEYLSKQPRVPIVAAGGSGAVVVIVKFNDYQCPPCKATYGEYKPVLARLQQQYPGKIAFITKDFPLETECNSLPNLRAPGIHLSACEAATAVRLAREKGRAEAMEEWLFANQATLTPEGVKSAAASVGGVTDFDARYAKTLELVRGDIAQGLQLGVSGTPTFFMNGIRLGNFPGPVFQAAVEWELRQVSAK